MITTSLRNEKKIDEEVTSAQRFPLRPSASSAVKFRENQTAEDAEDAGETRNHKPKTKKAGLRERARLSISQLVNELITCSRLYIWLAV